MTRILPNLNMSEGTKIPNFIKGGMGTTDINISLCSVKDDRISCHRIRNQVSTGTYRNMVRKTPPVKAFSFNGELLIYHFGCLTTEPAAKHASGTEQTFTEYQTG